MSAYIYDEKNKENKFYSKNNIDKIFIILLMTLPIIQLCPSKVFLLRVLIGLGLLRNVCTLCKSSKLVDLLLNPIGN